MAFLSENFQNSRTSAFTDTDYTRPAMHFYQTDDAIATVIASGYFNDLYNADLAGWENQPVKAGDEVYVSAGDGVYTLMFTAVASTMTTDYTRNWIVWTVQAETTTGGSATETYTVPGALGTDKALISFRVNGGTPVSVVSQSVSADSVEVVYSADPGSSREIDITVLRRPSLS